MVWVSFFVFSRCNLLRETSNDSQQKRRVLSQSKTDKVEENVKEIEIKFYWRTLDKKRLVTTEAYKIKQNQRQTTQRQLSLNIYVNYINFPTRCCSCRSSLLVHPSLWFGLGLSVGVSFICNLKPATLWRNHCLTLYRHTHTPTSRLECVTHGWQPLNLTL